jgi:hypothetical protein
VPYYAIFTTLGLQRLAEAQAAGVPLEFTELAVGDGNGAEITPSAGMTALVNETARVDVNLVEIHPGSANTVRVEGLIPAATGGFYIREAGLFNAAGELIAVASYPPIYKPELADGVTVDEYIRILLEYANVEDAIEITADLSVVAATRPYVDARTDALDERVTVLEETSPGHYGDASDGDATADAVAAVPGMSLVDTTYTLTRDCHFGHLTINSGVEVKTAGFGLYASKITTLGSGETVGRVTCNGNNGTGSLASTPGTGGAATATGTLLGGAAGGNGGGSPGSNGSSITNGMGGTGGGAGGDGGGPGFGSGGSGGSNTAIAAALGSPRSSLAHPGHVVGISGGAATWTALKGGAGGGGGGRGNAGSDAGGGGGGGGGVLVVCARELDLATVDSIQCRGGRGGDNSNVDGSGPGADGGGGGGGQGGLAILVYEKCNVTLTAAVVCAGGAGGAGGTSTGNDGDDGGTGTLVQFALGAGTALSSTHVEQGYITVGSVGAGTSYAVAFDSPFMAAFGDNGYDFEVSIAYTISSYDHVEWWITDKAADGFTINLTDDMFTGEIRWRAVGRSTT